MYVFCSFCTKYDIHVSSSWDKLTLVTEEGTKLVCSSLFFLAFYKDRYKNRHGKMRRLFTWELSVRVCQDEWVRVCVLQHKKGEETLLVRPRTTYWASRTTLSEYARGTRDKESCWGRSPWIPWWGSTRTQVQYLSCYTNVPKKEGGIFDILIRFTLKKRGLF